MLQCYNVTPLHPYTLTPLQRPDKSSVLCCGKAFGGKAICLYSLTQNGHFVYRFCKAALFERGNGFGYGLGSGNILAVLLRV